MCGEDVVNKPAIRERVEAEGGSRTLLPEVLTVAERDKMNAQRSYPGFNLLSPCAAGSDKARSISVTTTRRSWMEYFAYLRRDPDTFGT